MNQSEAQTLVTYLNRAGMLQALEGQAPVWADALDDVAPRDAQEAARALAKTAARWVTPGDIRQGAAQIRRRRLQDLQMPDPPEAISPDDTRRERAWKRAYIEGRGSGLDHDAADLAACRTVRVVRRDQIATSGDITAAVLQITAAMKRIPAAA